jgi:hypothetical protein
VSKPKRYKVEELSCCEADMVEHPEGEYVEYADYSALQKRYDDLEYCRGYVPFKEHNDYATKMSNLYYKTADQFNKLTDEAVSLREKLEEAEEAKTLTELKLYAQIERLEKDIQMLTTPIGIRVVAWLVSFLLAFTSAFFIQKWLTK